MADDLLGAVLAQVRHAGPCTAAEIGQVVPTDAVTIGKACERLSKRGDLERAGARRVGGGRPKVVWRAVCAAKEKEEADG